MSVAASIADNGAVGLELRESRKFGMVGPAAQIREILGLDNVNWSWNEKAHPMTVDAMLKCVSELATAARNNFLSGLKVRDEGARTC